MKKLRAMTHRSWRFSLLFNNENNDTEDDNVSFVDLPDEWGHGSFFSFSFSSSFLRLLLIVVEEYRHYLHVTKTLQASRLFTFDCTSFLRSNTWSTFSSLIFYHSNGKKHDKIMFHIENPNEQVLANARGWRESILYRNVFFLFAKQYTYIHTFRQNELTTMEELISIDMKKVFFDCCH